MKKSIVITGLGIVSSLGCDIENFWQNLLNGQSGISPISSFDTKDFGYNYAGEIKCFSPGLYFKNNLAARYGRGTQFAIAAAKMAIGKTKLPPQERIAICVGITGGEGQVIHDFSLLPPTNSKKLKIGPLYPPWKISENIGKELHLNSITYVFLMACSAGNHAIIRAVELLRSGQANYALAGGTEAMSSEAYAGFIKLRAMAQNKVQPFDCNRQGILIGEGSAMLLLEEKEQALRRGAKIYGEIIGYGINCEAYHITSPHPAGKGMSKAIEAALKMAKVSKDKIDYINAHGTGTIANDRTETIAIKNVFGNKAKEIPISSIKSMLGHTLGAASAIEAATCCLALRDNMIPPTINYETADPFCDLDYVPNKSRAKNLNIVLSNAFAFGGNNTALLIKKYNYEK